MDPISRMVSLEQEIQRCTKHQSYLFTLWQGKEDMLNDRCIMYWGWERSLIHTEMLRLEEQLEVWRRYETELKEQREVEKQLIAEQLCGQQAVEAERKVLIEALRKIGVEYRLQERFWAEQQWWVQQQAAIDMHIEEQLVEIEKQEELSKFSGAHKVFDEMSRRIGLAKIAAGHQNLDVYGLFVGLSGQNLLSNMEVISIPIVLCCFDLAQQVLGRDKWPTGIGTLLSSNEGLMCLFKGSESCLLRIESCDVDISLVVNGFILDIALWMLVGNLLAEITYVEVCFGSLNEGKDELDMPNILFEVTHIKESLSLIGCVSRSWNALLSHELHHAWRMDAGVVTWSSLISCFGHIKRVDKEIEWGSKGNHNMGWILWGFRGENEDNEFIINDDDEEELSFNPSSEHNSVEEEFLLKLDDSEGANLFYMKGSEIFKGHNVDTRMETKRSSSTTFDILSFTPLFIFGFTQSHEVSSFKTSYSCNNEMDVLGRSQDACDAILLTMQAILELRNVEFSPGKKHDCSIIKDRISHLEILAHDFSICDTNLTKGLPSEVLLDRALVVLGPLDLVDIIVFWKHMFWLFRLAVELYGDVAHIIAQESIQLLKPKLSITTSLEVQLGCSNSGNQIQQTSLRTSSFYGEWSVMIFIVHGLERKDDNEVPIVVTFFSSKYTDHVLATTYLGLLYWPTGIGTCQLFKFMKGVYMLSDLDKELKTYATRVREWYGWHFPEFAKIIQDNIQNAKVVKLMGYHVNTAKPDFSETLEEEIETELKEAAVISMGTEISELDLENIHILSPIFATVGSPSMVVVVRNCRGLDAKHGAVCHDEKETLRFYFRSFVPFNAASRTIMALWRIRILDYQEVQTLEFTARSHWYKSLKRKLISNTWTGESSKLWKLCNHLILVSLVEGLTKLEDKLVLRGMVCHDWFVMTTKRRVIRHRLGKLGCAALGWCYWAGGIGLVMRHRFTLTELLLQPYLI